MIKVVQGNIFDSDAQTLVNTVNCVGVMGKGIALVFKRAFPENFRAYEQACRNGQVRPGQMLVVPTLGIGQPRYIINFPTKRHWKGRSRLDDIRIGLDDLVEQIRIHDIKSVAVPALGCGHGGLNWADVEPMIREAFARIPEVRAQVYAPIGSLATTS